MEGGRERERGGGGYNTSFFRVKYHSGKNIPWYGCQLCVRYRPTIRFLPMVPTYLKIK
jgi:hypothetical protein